VLCDASRADFKEMVAELRDLNISVTVNLLHDERGAAEISGDEYLELWDYHYKHSKVISHIEYDYGRELLQGKKKDWLCRAGSRHLYVDEFGKAQFCASQRGRLDKPITEYTRDDIKRYASEPKGCEKGCAVFCVYRASQLDNEPVNFTKALLKSVRQNTVSLRGRSGNDRGAKATLTNAGPAERA